MVQFCSETPVPGFTFPDYNYFPSGLPAFLQFYFIPSNIFRKLVSPFPDIRFRYVSQFTALMLVPETSMNKDYSPVFWQYNVGSSRQILSVDAEPVTITVQPASDRPLRFRVFRADSAHHLAAFFRGDYVGHLTCSDISLIKNKTPCRKGWLGACPVRFYRPGSIRFFPCARATGTGETDERIPER